MSTEKSATSPLDQRAVWGIGSTVALAAGSVGAWITAGPFSIGGTSGDGDGWITLVIAAVAAVLVIARRAPGAVLAGGLFAAVVGVVDAVQIAGTDGSALFSVSIGWGLILVIVASVSLSLWGIDAVAKGPAQQRRLIAGAGIGAIVAALALTAALGRFDSGDEPKKPSPAVAQTTTAEAPSTTETATAAEPPPAPEENVIGLNESRSMNGITFRARWVRRVQSIGGDEFTEPTKPEAGEALYVARVTWTNDGQKPIEIFCGNRSAVLIDEDGRNFAPDDGQLQIEGNQICENVQPGLKRTVSLLFRTPKDATPNSLGLWNGGETYGAPDPKDLVQVVLGSDSDE